MLGDGLLEKLGNDGTAPKRCAALLGISKSGSSPWCLHYLSLFDGSWFLQFQSEQDVVQGCSGSVVKSFKT